MVCSVWAIYLFRNQDKWIDIWLVHGITRVLHRFGRDLQSQPFSIINNYVLKFPSIKTQLIKLLFPLASVQLTTPRHKSPTDFIKFKPFYIIYHISLVPPKSMHYAIQNDCPDLLYKKKKKRASLNYCIELCEQKSMQRSNEP